MAIVADHARVGCSSPVSECCTLRESLDSAATPATESLNSAFASKTIAACFAGPLTWHTDRTIGASRKFKWHCSQWRRARSRAMSSTS
jgi:hypothetical protein